MRRYGASVGQAGCHAHYGDHAEFVVLLPNRVRQQHDATGFLEAFDVIQHWSIAHLHHDYSCLFDCAKHPQQLWVCQQLVTWHASNVFKLDRSVNDVFGRARSRNTVFDRAQSATNAFNGAPVVLVFDA